MVGYDQGIIKKWWSERWEVEESFKFQVLSLNTGEWVVGFIAFVLGCCIIRLDIRMLD